MGVKERGTHAGFYKPPTPFPILKGRKGGSGRHRRTTAVKREVTEGAYDRRYYVPRIKTLKEEGKKEAVRGTGSRATTTD